MLYVRVFGIVIFIIIRPVNSGAKLIWNNIYTVPNSLYLYYNLYLLKKLPNRVANANK